MQQSASILNCRGTSGGRALALQIQSRSNSSTRSSARIIGREGHATPRLTGDANAIGTKHRILNPPQPAILNPAILNNLAAAPYHAPALAIAPERTCRFIQKTENVTVSSRTQSPCDMASRPSKHTS